MNVFFRFGDTVVTPPLEDSLLAGVTRDSVLALLKRWKIRVEERPVAIAEVAEQHAKGQLQEAFGSGTAATVSPIGELQWGERKLHIGRCAGRALRPPPGGRSSTSSLPGDPTRTAGSFRCDVRRPGGGGRRRGGDADRRGLSPGRDGRPVVLLDRAGAFGRGSGLLHLGGRPPAQRPRGTDERRPRCAVGLPGLARAARARGNRGDVRPAVALRGVPRRAPGRGPRAWSAATARRWTSPPPTAGFVSRLDDGATLEAPAVVVAPGNLPPTLPPGWTELPSAPGLAHAVGRRGALAASRRRGVAPRSGAHRGGRGALARRPRSPGADPRALPPRALAAHQSGAGLHRRGTPRPSPARPAGAGALDPHRGGAHR